jgi:hypothetical protein
LVAAVNSVRLARKAREALKIPLAGTRYFTDSSAVLGMLRTESGKFNEFVGARVSEVKVNSNVEDEWRWLEGNCNPADLGTRSRATPRDMIFGSEYQVGKPWMSSLRVPGHARNRSALLRQKSSEKTCRRELAV